MTNSQLQILVVDMVDCTKLLERENLDGKVQYHGFDINQKLISFCKNNKDFENIKFSISAFPFNKTDYVVMSGTYNLTPTNNISLWEDYIIKNLTSNWKLVQKAMIFNCLIKEKNKLIKHYIIQRYPGLKKFVKITLEKYKFSKINF